MKNNEAIFTKIYKDNRWGSDESISGRGSELRQTIEVSLAINDVVTKRKVNSVLDAPCGDFNWMPHVLSQFPNVSYLGVDIVKPIIGSLQQKYSDHSNWRFAVADITEDQLPSSDLIICRDCLVHLSNEDVKLALGNFALSGAKFLLTTQYPNELINVDTIDGHWRPINLLIPPFSLPEYIDIYDTDYRDGGRNHPGNHLALWDIDSLKGKF